MVLEGITQKYAVTPHTVASASTAASAPDASTDWQKRVTEEITQKSAAEGAVEGEAAVVQQQAVELAEQLQTTELACRLALLLALLLAVLLGCGRRVIMSERASEVEIKISRTSSLPSLCMSRTHLLARTLARFAHAPVGPTSD